MNGTGAGCVPGARTAMVAKTGNVLALQEEKGRVCLTGNRRCKGPVSGSNWQEVSVAGVQRARAGMVGCTWAIQDLRVGEGHGEEESFALVLRGVGRLLREDEAYLDLE